MAQRLTQIISHRYIEHTPMARSQKTLKTVRKAACMLLVLLIGAAHAQQCWDRRTNCTSAKANLGCAYTFSDGVTVAQYCPVTCCTVPSKPTDSDYCVCDYPKPGPTGELEQRALKDLYHATKGASWQQQYGWLSGGVEHCKWFGIRCNSAGYVTVL